MSFSSEVKEELSRLNIFSNIELVKAELYGYLLTVNTDNKKIEFLTENEYNINRLNKLLNKLNIDYNIKMQGKSYKIDFRKKDLDLTYGKNSNQEEKKAKVRGAFLGSGSITEPNSRYHLEIKLKTEARKKRSNSCYRSV